MPKARELGTPLHRSSGVPSSSLLRRESRLRPILIEIWKWKLDDFHPLSLGTGSVLRQLLEKQPQCILLNRLPVFGVFSLDALAFGHRVPPHDEFAGASIVPRFTAVCKGFPSRELPKYVKSHTTKCPTGR